ncbi:unnamed protein product [Gongylonema pulchrum]|uniref:CUE domain-containing protein n=1 Tax=Gongylonema pulchrum TaxID=637853 RepID=A0A183EYJ9_9BILA|nr:unnamed protein product [Gongylonema pulchrum]
MTTESKRDDNVADDEELSTLLDSALSDFGRFRNTDEELDSMMEVLDQEAVEKAIQNFDDAMSSFQHKQQQQGEHNIRQVSFV